MPDSTEVKAAKKRSWAPRLQVLYIPIRSMASLMPPKSNWENSLFNDQGKFSGGQLLVLRFDDCQHKNLATGQVVLWEALQNPTVRVSSFKGRGIVD